jgi:Domain of unknown function (DUF4178)
MNRSAPVVNATGLNCPNCGAALTIRGFDHTLTVVCPKCLSILDAKDPNFQILQKFRGKQRILPRIPLGSRGQWRGATYEVIGFQERTIEVDGIKYSWYEYLLFNPYKGFRYLTEYNGHWNDVRTISALPIMGRTGNKPTARYREERFTHFQTARAETTYVLGEFPWQTERGETVTAMDYISPPRVLSSETTTTEVVWSLGEYVTGDEIWKAFQLKGAPPRAAGIYADQPSPYIEARKNVWKIYWVFILAILSSMLVMLMISRNEEVFSQRYSFTPGRPAEASFVTSSFDLKGRPSDVDLEIRTDLSNNWAYFSFALINDETGQAYNFGREVSYYFGRDSDGSWTEGSAGDTATIPTVPSGRYYLRVEPEMAPNARAMTYLLRVRRDVLHTKWYWIAALVLLIPPVAATIRSSNFEFQRWQESDYASSSSDSDDDDSDGDDD